MTANENRDIASEPCSFDRRASPIPDDFSFADPKILEKPNPYYAILRNQDPVHYDEKLGMYIVAKYEDVQTVLRDAITFSQERGWNRQFAQGYFEELKAILVRDGGGYFPEVLLLDPPGHTRIRNLLIQAFDAHRIKQLEPRIKSLIVDWIEKIADRGEADGVNEFAAPLTIDIMCEQLGFPHAEAAHKIQVWARAYVDQVGGMQTHEQMLANAQRISELQLFIIDRVNERRVERKDDMISDLVHAWLEEDQNAKLTFEETVALTLGLLLAGNDTTASALSNFLFLIATRPDIAEHLYQVIDDDSQVAHFVEELMRISPPVRGLFRVTTKEVELGGKRLPEDAHVLMLFASANDDEQVFACPRSFDIDRKNVIKHLSFGGGIHLCAGIALARMELKVAVREIMTRLKDIKLTKPVEEIRYIPSIANMSLASLPLTFSRRG